MSHIGRNYVSNRDELTSHGNVSLRNTAIDIIEHALEAANPYSAVMGLLQLDGDLLRIEDLILDMSNYERIFIIGAGKASLGIAQALEEILGDRIEDGLVVLKYGSETDFTKVRTLFASHPYPDQNSHLGGRLLMDFAEPFTENDLVFAGITGGSSALLALPVDGVTFDDIKKVNQLLILSGADIISINTVRKHLSKIKGGWLADQILPATLINLTVSDVVGDMLDYITGPTVPDTSTFDDARRVMDTYDLYEKFPPSASEYIRNGRDAQETPKDFADLPLFSFVVVPGDAACVGSFERAEELGFNTMILTSMLTGEAKDAGALFASIAKEVVMFGRPFTAPCAIIAGGENVVTVGTGDYGHGGPNQEFTLSASLEIAGFDRVLISSIDTDGLDGVTNTAGGMVDGNSVARAMEKGLDAAKALRDHDAGFIINEIGDAVLTGLTGTNVNDLKILLVT